MIRYAKKEDLNAILAIYNDAIINTTAVYTYETNVSHGLKRNNVSMSLSLYLRKMEVS